MYVENGIITILFSRSRSLCESVTLSREHHQLLGLHPVASLTLGGFQRDQSGNGMGLIGEPVHPDLTALP